MAIDAQPRTALSRHSFVRMLNNMFELPSITMTILYLHTSLVFPTKLTWIKDIQKGYFATW